MNKHITFFILILSSFPVFSQSISTSAISPTSYCQSSAISVPYTITGSFNGGNVFTAQLSDASGNFTSPTTIGSVNSTSSGTISATLPNSLLAGNAYRIRVVSSDPVVTGSDNGANLTLSGDTSNPNGFGNNTWKVFCYNGSNANLANNQYFGHYTHNGVDFNSTDRWGMNNSPSSASGYVGCTLPNDHFTIRYKRQGFPCGNYQIDLRGTVAGQTNGHDDAVTVFVDGVQVFQNNGCCAQRINVWSGFLGANSQVEIRVIELTGQAYARAIFNQLPNLDVSGDITMCPGSTAVLKANNSSIYDWSSNTTHVVGATNLDSLVISPPIATPNSVEVYTVLGYDIPSNCSLTGVVNVTIDNSFSPTISDTAFYGCGIASMTQTIEVGGGSKYTWSPMAGVTLLRPNGSLVSITTNVNQTYTVTIENGCSSTTRNVEFNLSTSPGNPSVFGNEVWNVYAYDGNNFNTYRGYYVEDTLDFDSRLTWNLNGSPSDAPNYVGCSIPVNNHSYKYMRKGFPCGFYQLDIPNHDDGVWVYINGDLAFTQATWFSNQVKNNIWQGYLGPESEIEYRISEQSGGSHAGLRFNYLFGPDNNANERVWGGETDSLWSTASNWCGGVPTNAHTVRLANNGTLTMPVIQGSHGNASQITVYAGAELKIKNASSLTVSNAITNNGTITVDHSGSIVQTHGGANTNSGTGTYSIRKTGFSNINRYNAWSSPISNPNLFSVFSDANPCDVYAFHASIQNWRHPFSIGFSDTCNGNPVTFQAQHVLPGSNGTMEAGRGYFIPGSPNATRTFTGEIHNGTYTKAISKQVNPGNVNWTNDDWNLVGNPYPSAIDADLFWQENAVNNSRIISAIYMWDDDGSAGAGYAESDYASWNPMGAVMGPNSNVLPNGHIASGQGFWVVANANANIVFNNSMRSTDNDQFFSNRSKTFPRIWLNLENKDKFFNQILIAFPEDGSNDYEELYDAPKLEANASIYFASKLDEKELMIHSREPLSYTNRFDTIDLMFKTLEVGNHSLKVFDTDNFDKINVRLFDAEFNRLHPILDTDYFFQVQQAGTYSNRFKLVFEHEEMGHSSGGENPIGSPLNPTTAIENMNILEGFKVNALAEQIQIKSIRDSKISYVQVYDLQGRLLTELDGNNSKQIGVDASGFSSGIYLVNVMDENKSNHTYKIYIP